MEMREGIESKQQEMSVYDKAIQEIEKSYGHIIFSEEFFVDDENPQSKLSVGYWFNFTRFVELSGYACFVSMSWRVALLTDHNDVISGTLVLPSTFVICVVYLFILLYVVYLSFYQSNFTNNILKL